MNPKTVEPEIERILGPQTIVHSVERSGKSGWCHTLKISTSKGNYFLKECSDYESAEPMFRGEAAALKHLHDMMPTACPEPYGWGQYKNRPGTWFLLMEFLDFAKEASLLAKTQQDHSAPSEQDTEAGNFSSMKDAGIKLPTAKQIAQFVSEMHKSTSGTSPDGKFGFHVPTCHGKFVQPNDWNSSWSQYFSNLLTLIYEMDINNGGASSEYEKAFKTLQKHTIPRLLEPLQADGRVLNPCLVHGDLWEGNMGLSEETGEPMVYDPALFYAHNEFELGMWQTTFVPRESGQAYRDHYLQLVPPSEPKEEYEDRIVLYSLFFNMCHSMHWTKETQQSILEDMTFLNNKYLTDEDATSGE
ncbi:Fructosamine kinase-domain-containing protein [Xylariaceae sp. FL1019]|nr:Fructosamine kinase-domain-containing protein [Xylariaceae sp. FL1019]